MARYAKTSVLIVNENRIRVHCFLGAGGESSQYESSRCTTPDPYTNQIETLGHAQIATTADIYSHVLPAMMEESAARMDAVLSS